MRSKALDHDLYDRERVRDARITELTGEALRLRQRLDEVQAELLRLKCERGDAPEGR